MYSLSSNTLSNFLTIARNRHDDEIGRPYQLRSGISPLGAKDTHAQSRGLRFGSWTIGSKQRRLGDANDYRRHIFSEPEEYTDKSVKDLLRYLKRTLRDLFVPYARFRTENVRDIASIITTIHNANYLETTLVVVPSISESLMNETRSIFDDVDYTLDPTSNADKGIFRKYQPIISSTMDMSDNHMCIIDSQTFSNAVTKEWVAFHYKAVVIIIDAEAIKDGECFKEGAKYISNQIMFIETGYFSAAPDVSDLDETSRLGRSATAG